jgi:hypothetical protein
VAHALLPVSDFRSVLFSASLRCDLLSPSTSSMERVGFSIHLDLWSTVALACGTHIHLGAHSSQRLRASAVSFELPITRDVGDHGDSVALCLFLGFAPPIRTYSGSFPVSFVLTFCGQLPLSLCLSISAITPDTRRPLNFAYPLPYPYVHPSWSHRVPPDP